jgi:hypothetical protein
MNPFFAASAIDELLEIQKIGRFNAAFLDELEKIAMAGAVAPVAKAVKGGVMNFLGKGFNRVGGAISSKNVGNLGGKIGREKGFFGGMKHLYNEGATAAHPTLAGQQSGWWGGVKNVAKSPYGQSAAAIGTVAAPVAWGATR